jgi:hypothetical protein
MNLDGPPAARRAVIAFAAASVAVSLQCRRTPAVPPVLGVAVQDGWRMIEAEPEEVFNAARFYGRPASDATTFDLGSANETRAWTLGGESADPTPKGIRAVHGDGEPEFARAVDIDAADVCLVSVEARGWRGAPRLELYWTRPGGSSGMSPAAAEGSPVVVAAFPVAGHAGWFGRIARLRVRAVGGRRGDRVTLRRVALHGCRTPDLEDLKAAARKPWRIEAALERRLSLLLVPGVEHEWTVTVPREGELLFATTGRPSNRRSAAASVDHVEVEALGADGHATGIRQSFEARAGGWTEARVSLAALAGRRVRLRLRLKETGAESYAALAEPRLATPTAPPAPDVVLISMDTVRADRLSLYGYGGSTTPAIDAWARRHAVAFRHAFSGGASTLPSHAAMLSGRHAFRGGVIDGGYTPLHPSLELLAQRLRRAGYRTAAITGGAFMHPSLGFERGFDSYGWAATPGAEVLERQLERALATLDQPSDRPLFLLFHTYEAHRPYLYRGLIEAARPCHVGLELITEAAAADTARRVFWKGPPEAVASAPPAAGCIGPLYDDGLAYLDRHLGRLLERLSRPDRRRVVVVTADHGEALGEAGRFDHGWSHLAVMRVPLLVAAPGLPAGTWSDAQACGVDVTPTLLRLAGQPVPGGLDGRPLFTDPTPRPCVSFTLRPTLGLARHEPEGRTVVLDFARPDGKPVATGDRRAWAYDRSGDPDALRPWRVPAEDPSSRVLQGHVVEIGDERERRKRALTAGADAPPELLEQLRALGYVH